jgi:flagellar FliL protein
MSAVLADPAMGHGPVKRGKKKLIIIGAALLVLATAIAGGAIFYLKQKAAHAAAAAEAGDDEGGAAEHAPSAKFDPHAVPVYLPLDPFVVNLADKEADRYAQIGITLELDNGVSADQIKAYMPSIRNAILMVIAGKTSHDLIDRAGKEQLAQDIMRESVRPMGIEIADPEPVTAAPASASAPASAAAMKDKAASDPASADDAASVAAAKPKARAKPRRDAQHNPILHVHFSSFIIQ